MRKPSGILQRVNIVCHTPLFECLDVILQSTQNKEQFSTTHACVCYGTFFSTMSVLLHTHENGRFLVVVDTDTDQGRRNHGMYEHDTHWNAEG